MTGTEKSPAMLSGSDQSDDLTRVMTTADRVVTADVVTHSPSSIESTQRMPPTSDAPSSNSTMTLSKGARLAEFEITGVIGQGGFGVVYEAWDHALERTVAIKEYLPTSLAHRVSEGSVVPISVEKQETFRLGMRSFINEARLLAQFDHASLLKVYRFWEEGGTAYMVMPLYRGKTLRQALDAQNEPPSEHWLLGILDSVSQALSVMHASRCFHRDIAPDNILLQEETGLPVVLDFGAARRVITDKTQAVTVILKPGYAPVEQYGDVPDAPQGAWTDVYALAAVAHYAICRKVPPPSVGRILTDTYQPLALNPTLARGYSATLLKAIDLGLAVLPRDRPQSMEEFRAALGFESDDAANKRDVVTALPISGRSTSHWRWIVASAAAAIVAFAGWFAIRTQPAPTASPSPAAQEPPQVRVESSSSVPSSPPEPVKPRTVEESLAALSAATAPGFEVEATPKKTEVRIGKDELSFDVKSSRNGYVYVFLLSSGGELFMLFPNLLDKHNRIAAGTPLTLPRASWPMNAGGPAGENRFAVIVSEHERDFADTGMRHDGVFPQFSLPLLEALEAETARKGGEPPLLGKVVCPSGSTCSDAVGVAHFKIVEK